VAFDSNQKSRLTPVRRSYFGLATLVLVVLGFFNCSGTFAQAALPTDQQSLVPLVSKFDSQLRTSGTALDEYQTVQSKLECAVPSNDGCRFALAILTVHLKQASLSLLDSLGPAMVRPFVWAATGLVSHAQCICWCSQISQPQSLNNGPLSPTVIGSPSNDSGASLGPAGPNPSPPMAWPANQLPVAQVPNASGWPLPAGSETNFPAASPALAGMPQAGLGQAGIAQADPAFAIQTQSASGQSASGSSASDPSASDPSASDPSASILPSPLMPAQSLANPSQPDSLKRMLQQGSTRPQNPGLGGSNLSAAGLEAGMAGSLENRAVLDAGSQSQRPGLPQPVDPQPFDPQPFDPQRREDTTISDVSRLQNSQLQQRSAARTAIESQEARAQAPNREINNSASLQPILGQSQVQRQGSSAQGVNAQGTNLPGNNANFAANNLPSAMANGPSEVAPLPRRSSNETFPTRTPLSNGQPEPVQSTGSVPSPWNPAGGQTANNGQPTNSGLGAGLGLQGNSGDNRSLFQQNASQFQGNSQNGLAGNGNVSGVMQNPANPGSGGLPAFDGRSQLPALGNQGADALGNRNSSLQNNSLQSSNWLRGRFTNDQAQFQPGQTGEGLAVGNVLLPADRNLALREQMFAKQQQVNKWNPNVELPTENSYEKYQASNQKLFSPVKKDDGLGNILAGGAGQVGASRVSRQPEMLSEPSGTTPIGGTETTAKEADAKTQQQNLMSIWTLGLFFAVLVLGFLHVDSRRKYRQLADDLQDRFFREP